MQKAELASSQGELDLATLLANLKPSLDEQPYVFISIPIEDSNFMPDFPIKGMFREREGYTCIIDQRVADDQGFGYSELFCCLTCEIHSSLSAVGLTAALSTALAKHNISANIVAGYYHDHIFIPKADAHRALGILNQF